MGRVSKVLSAMFGVGLLGAIAMTIITPTMISILFTPPVSFGTNCEPAAAWSMQKLVTSQVSGLIVGLILGAVFHVWLARRKKVSESRELAASPSP